MSIVGAALLPHTPLLLPTTEPAHAKRMRGLQHACEEAAQWVHALQPDIILCINPHAPSFGDHYTFNLAKQYTGTFENFGDLTTNVTVPAAPKFSYHLKEHLEAHAPVAAVHDASMTYGMSVPALLLRDLHPQPRWVEMSTSTQSPAAHVRFGALLHPELVQARERVVLIASGELSARCSDEAPTGKSQKASAFCAAWQTATRERKLQRYLETVTNDDVREVLSCGALSTALLAGCTNALQLKPTVHVEETLYGVAYSVVTWQPV